MITRPWKSYMQVDPRREYLALITYLPRKSFWSIRSFVRQSGMIQEQLEDARGLVGYSMRVQLLGKKAWTLSVWEDEAALQEFVRKSPPADTMRKPIIQPGKARFVRFKLDGSKVTPSWDEALGQLDARS